MRAKILNLGYDPTLGGFDDGALQAALADKDVLCVEARFFDVDPAPRLSCLVIWREHEPDDAEAASNGHAETAPRRKPRATAIELSGEERRVFEVLRVWRRARAVELGVPAFRVLTDRQLASVARARPLETVALAALDGVGTDRARRCGDELFAAVRRAGLESVSTG